MLKERGQWQGMQTIARLNWPFYLVALLVLVASILIFVFMPGKEIRIVSGIVMAGAAYFVFVSLGVSHLVYDRSDLYRWQWLDRALGGTARNSYIFCHAGFDDASSSLREKVRASDWTVLDHYDPSRMTEASIQRARRLFPPAPGTLAAPFDKWPVASDATDVIFGLLAIHELRTDAERSAWFAEAKRCLRAGGRIVIVEHVRDVANFLAFGPGFLHFHSPSRWRRSWEAAGLRAHDEFRLTPWLRVFILSLP